MSVIQQIRDKAAWLVFGLIALSLIGFLLMDAFVGKSRMFGGNTTEVGAVNGQAIDYASFQKQVTDREDAAKASGYPMNDMMQQNIKDQVWKQFVEEAVLSKEYVKLGLNVSDKELNDMLVGPNAIADIKKSFTDPKTGIFDAQAAASTINQLRTIYTGNKKSDKGYEQAKHFFEESIPQIILSRQREKYLALLSNSVYTPKWMAEKMNTDANEIAAIQYVDIPYSTIADSTIKVSDDDIREYINAHQEQFKQEETRSIAYVSFNAAPTSGDTAATLQQVQKLKPEFDTTKDVTAFIARNGSETGYQDAYLPKSQIQLPHKDSIFLLPKGGVFGPYLDAGTYVMAKKVDERTIPDTIKCRHILIKTADAQKGQLRDDSTAKKLIDSIAEAVKNGADFNQLVLKYSEDEGSKNNKGEYQFASTMSLVKPFYETVFYSPVGTKKVVKAESQDYAGYHYIEVLSQRNFEPAFKIAQLSKKIDASPETDQNASGLANQFAGESRNIKAFDENVQKKNLQKLLAPDILPAESNIPALGTNRQLVKWLYDDKTGLGDVSEPYSIGDKYVVAVVTEINEKGTTSVAKARATVEPILRNRQKADQIIKKIGAAATLEAVAAATTQQVQKSDSISFASPYIPNVGMEPKVIGSSFNKQLQAKPVSPAIGGNGGVFVIKVEQVSAKSNLNTDLEQLRANQQRQQQSMVSYRAIEVLQKSAKIKDNRSKFF